MTNTVRLTHREVYADDVLALRFTRPENYTFKEGQWCFLNLPDLGLNDERGLRRHLTIASAPDEDHLVFATKISPSAFKQTLTRIKVGDEIEIEDPKGRLCLPESPEAPLCFLAGGIGITPFRSLTRQSVLADTGHDITLIYSSKTPEVTPFLSEIQKLDDDCERFRCLVTMTGMEQSSVHWNGREGRMNAKMIQEAFPHLNDGLFVVCGPPKMVGAMVEMLEQLDIQKERIQVEKFMGY